jgi:hypothetical protein
MQLKLMHFNEERGEKGQNVALFETAKGRTGPIVMVTAPGPRRMTKAAVRKHLEAAIQALEV